MKRNVPAVLFGILIALFLAQSSTLGGRPSTGPPAVLAQERGWKTEYESVCAKTDMAMALSVEELKGLIARCDKLKPQIDKEEESTRKVYMRRLHMCRDLYHYVLDSKESR